MTGQEKVDDNSRGGGALPLTPQTKELSPVKDHRYRRRRKRRRGGKEKEGEEEKEDSSNSYDQSLFVNEGEPLRGGRKKKV